jgi:hypothetical protein
VDLRHDLCVLLVPGIRGDAVVRGRAASLRPGQPVAAVGYMLDNEPHLRVFLANAAVPIDNNTAEQKMRRVALGRANYLFARSANGGKALAILYSVRPARTSELLSLRARHAPQPCIRRSSARRSSQSSQRAGFRSTHSHVNQMFRAGRFRAGFVATEHRTQARSARPYSHA